MSSYIIHKLLVCLNVKRNGTCVFEKLIDEYRVFVFAPELGTAIPVSPKRLNEVWKRLSALL